MAKKVPCRQEQHVRQNEEDKNLAYCQLQRVIQIVGGKEWNLVDKEAGNRKTTQCPGELHYASPPDLSLVVVIFCLSTEVNRLLCYAFLCSDSTYLFKHTFGILAVLLHLSCKASSTILHHLQRSPRFCIQALEVGRTV